VGRKFDQFLKDSCTCDNVERRSMFSTSWDQCLKFITVKYSLQCTKEITLHSKYYVSRPIYPFSNRPDFVEAVRSVCQNSQHFIRSMTDVLNFTAIKYVCRSTVKLCYAKTSDLPFVLPRNLQEFIEAKNF